MRTPTAALALALMLVAAGCGNRTSLPPDEATTVHRITMPLEQGPAFLATEEALAMAWNSWQDVSQLRQPETGTIIVKGLFPYFDETGNTSGGASARVKVHDRAIEITYQIGRNRDGWYPSESGVRQMRDSFGSMTAAVADGVGGEVVEGSPAPAPAAAAPAPRAARPAGR